MKKFADPRDLDAVIRAPPWADTNVQRKRASDPVVGPANDALEQEADRVADQVLANPANPANPAALHIQRNSGQAADGRAPAPPSVGDTLADAGRPLEPTVRRPMEQRFGHDFSSVRVHSGHAAAQSARDIDANAYTAGHDIVFAAGKLSPESREGQRLIAHELTHVIQQERGQRALQRDAGPKVSATPADWKDKIANATTSADKAALIQSVVTPVKVVDKTTEAAGDDKVDVKHCVKWDDANPTVSYDDGLNAKKGRASDAGFTKNPGGSTDYYIVLGPKVLDPKDLTTTTLILNHEFDHVREMRAGSKLKGDESEIATWTTTFVREFHRSYIIRDRSDGITSYVDPGYATFTQLGNYYARSTDSAVKTAAVQKIADYYAAVIKPHAVHDKVFRYWIHRGINKLGIADLCNDVNDKLGKIVDPTQDVKDYWEMPTSIVKAAKFTGPPVVTKP